MKIVIDSNAGFCPGVKHAIKKAEKNLRKDDVFYCLGDLLHNEQEMERLERQGLKVVDAADIPGLEGQKLLLRAHGEPPETYVKAHEHDVKVVDTTCGVVRRLQQRVRQAAEEMDGLDGQLVIFGKHGHPEVAGLLGNAGERGIVVSSIEELENVDASRPVRLFSQTTMDRDDYLELAAALQQRVDRSGGQADLIRHDSICRHVSERVPALREFAAAHELIIFVSGRRSSNGNKLFRICKAGNPDSYFISGPGELDASWFAGVDSVGISGSASTPLWLMEKVAEKIKALL
jgi:4-hydroxy-3-methylbut-2-enyl diphosphate reductase